MKAIKLILLLFLLSATIVPEWIQRQKDPWHLCYSYSIAIDKLEGATLAK